MKLTVRPSFVEDNYKDTVRVHRKYRRGLKSGRLARIGVHSGESSIVAVRGLDDDEVEDIRVDLETRRRLKVALNTEYEFELSRIWFWEGVIWACRASDPALRIASWIAVLSAILGLIGIALGILPFVHSQTRPTDIGLSWRLVDNVQALLNLSSAAFGIVAAIFWFMSAWPTKQRDTGAQIEVLRQGTSPERSRVTRLNRWAALFTGLAALLLALGQLPPLR